MSDENQNSTDGGQDLQAKKRRIQYDILIVDADLKKIIAKKERLLMELKRLERESDLLKVQIEDKDKERKNLESEEMLKRNEIMALKKKESLIK